MTTLALLFGLLLTAEDIRALAATDDVRFVAEIEQALERRLAAEPAPDVEEEVVACLDAMGRLDPDRAAARAGEVLVRWPTPSSPFWAARRLLAQSGDRETIRRALVEYFDAPEAWRRVLAAAAPHDVRLADFLPWAPSSEGDPEERLRTRLARNLGEADARPPSPPFAPFHEGAIGPALDTGGDADGALATLEPNDRFRRLRALAAADSAVLNDVPMDGETIGRLSFYLARSRYAASRARLHRASAHRGRALAGILRSPIASDAEKRRALEVMRDGWAEAFLEPDTLPAALSLIGPEALVARAPVEALAHLPLPSARARLEGLAPASPGAVRALSRRDDRILSLPLFHALERSETPAVRLEAEKALLMLGAGGSSLILRTSAGPPPLQLVPFMLRSAVDGERLLREVAALAEEPSPSPDALALLYALNAERPELFITFLRHEPGPLTERFRFVLSLAGEPKRIPLLVDIAVSEGSSPSREAAFVGLAEVELGPFDKRLHRLAGDSDRTVRFRAACALAPSGEPWVLRLLLADIDESSERERRLARHALSRLEADEVRRLLTAMVRDATAGAFAVDRLLDLQDAPARALELAMWERLRDGVANGEPLALVTASRLGTHEARAAVRGHLEGL